jgi:hypothetical protein
LGKAARIQTCTTNERSVDIWLSHELVRVVRLHTTTVLNADLVRGGFIANFTKSLANERMCFLAPDPPLQFLPVPIAQTGS